MHQARRVVDRKRFHTESSRALERIDETLGDLEHTDLDVDLAGDVLTLSFSDGSRFVINAHSAAEQIWMAAEKTAWHFDFDEGTSTWIAHKTDDELMRTVSRVVGQKLGTEISL